MSVFLAVTLAVAQPATPPPLSKAETEAVRALHIVGECLGKRYANDARKVLALDFRTKGYGQALRELGRLGGLCARDDLGRATLRSPGLPFAGSIAEALLEHDGILSDFAGKTGYRSDVPAIDARNASEFMAFCTVRKDPAGVVAMLRSDPASSSEAAAFAAMSTILSGCVPAKSELEFSYQSIRALLALGAYRLAMHNADALPRQEAAQ